MNTNDTFDFVDEDSEDLLEPDSKNFDAHVSKTQSQIDGPVSKMKNIMMYAAGQSKIEGDAGVGAISYSELADALPQNSISKNISQLADNGFLEIHFYTLDELASDDESLVMTPEKTNRTTEEVLSYIDDEAAYEQDKLALPGVNDALVSIGPVGRQYIEEKGLEYAGEQAVKADKRSRISDSEYTEDV